MTDDNSDYATCWFASNTCDYCYHEMDEKHNEEILENKPQELSTLLEDTSTGMVNKN